MRKVFAWVDGVIGPAEDSPLALAEPGVFPERGLFETIRVAEGFPWFLRRHRERLERSCGARGIPIDPAAFDRTVYDSLIEALDPPRGFARLRSLALASGRVIHTASIEDPPPFDAPFRLAIDTERRADPEARFKSLPHAFCARAQREARARGFDGALLIAPDGTILEGSYHSIFRLRGCAVARPPEDLPRLIGITERVLLEAVFPELGIEVEDRSFRPEEIEGGDGLILANSMVGTVAATAIEGRPLADARPFAAKLRDRIRAAAIEEEAADSP